MKVSPPRDTEQNNLLRTCECKWKSLLSPTGSSHDLSGPPSNQLTNGRTLRLFRFPASSRIEDDKNPLGLEAHNALPIFKLCELSVSKHKQRQQIIISRESTLRISAEQQVMHRRRPLPSTCQRFKLGRESGVCQLHAARREIGFGPVHLSRGKKLGVRKARSTFWAEKEASGELVFSEVGGVMIARQG